MIFNKVKTNEHNFKHKFSSTYEFVLLSLVRIYFNKFFTFETALSLFNPHNQFFALTYRLVSCL